MNFGVAPIPHADGKESITLGVQDYFFGFKKEGNQEAIQKFLNFLFEPDNYAGFLEAAGGFLPATISAGEPMSSDPALAPFIEVLPDGDLLPERPGRLAGRAGRRPAEHRDGAVRAPTSSRSSTRSRLSRPRSNGSIRRPRRTSACGGPCRTAGAPAVVSAGVTP